MVVLIYLVGFILAYYLFRYLVMRQKDAEWSWFGVFAALMFGAGSWFTVVAMSAVILIEYIDTKDLKPPKWL